MHQPTGIQGNIEHMGPANGDQTLPRGVCVSEAAKPDLVYFVGPARLGWCLQLVTGSRTYVAWHMKAPIIHWSCRINKRCFLVARSVIFHNSFIPFVICRLTEDLWEE